MMKKVVGIAVSFLALGAWPSMTARAAAAQGKPSVQTAQQAASAHRPAAHESSPGERIFAQNCSRCHNAPDGFSPRIAGTVVHHMRVRAQLSAHDQQELLRFLNP
jgi:cytochrome c5